MKILRVLQERTLDIEILVDVDLDQTPPRVHVATRKQPWHSWGPPAREIDNQDLNIPAPAPATDGG